jgi:hypothetical protein
VFSAELDLKLELNQSLGFFLVDRLPCRGAAALAAAGRPPYSAR